MSDQPEIRYLGDVQRLTLAPDDVVILKMRRCISDETAGRIREKVREELGPDRKFLILDDGIEIGMLSPEPA